MLTPFPRDLRPFHRNPIGACNLTGKTLLHILAQGTVQYQFRDLRPTRSAFRMPLGGCTLYSKPPARVAALRRSSREMVDGSRFSLLAM